MDIQKYKKDVDFTIKKYSVKAWLTFIRDINIKMIYDEDFRNKQENILRNKPEFLISSADISLRRSPYEIQNKYTPSFKELNLLGMAEIEISDSDGDNLIELFGIAAISLMAFWQNRFNYNTMNVLGRLNKYYRRYDEQLIDGIGLSIDDIGIIYYAIFINYQQTPCHHLEKYAIFNKNVTSLSKEKIDKFFNYFSTSIKDYRLAVRDDGISTKDYGKFKYLLRYPMIELEENLYIIPVFEQLLDTIANNLYFVLLDIHSSISRSKSHKFLSEHGDIFEEYILSLLVNCFDKKDIQRADSLAKTKQEKRCEVVITHDDKKLAIEVKSTYFKRDSISNKNKEEIDKKLREKLVEGYIQLEATMDNIEDAKYTTYGLIVIPDIMMAHSTIINYMKEEFEGEARFDDRIMICSLSWLESLTANTRDNLFLILANTYKADPIKDGNDILPTMQQLKKDGIDINFTNPYLRSAVQEPIDRLSKSIYR